MYRPMMHRSIAALRSELNRLLTERVEVSTRPLHASREARLREIDRQIDHVGGLYVVAVRISAEAALAA